MSAIAESSALNIFGAYPPTPLFSVCIANTGLRALSGVCIANAGVTGVLPGIGLCSATLEGGIYGFQRVDARSKAKTCRPQGRRYITPVNLIVTPPPPPCYAHQYQNKRVRSINPVMNIKTKDLARRRRFGAVKSFVIIFLRTDAKFMERVSSSPRIVRDAEVAF
jgi:hypothetical protein